MDKTKNPEVCPKCEDELLTRYDDDEYDNLIDEDWFCEKCDFKLRKKFKLVFMGWETLNE